MAIVLQDMLQRKANSFGQSTESKRFVDDFLAAVDAVSADLRLRTSLEPEKAKSTSTKLSLDEDKYENVYTHGVDFFLLVFGVHSERDLTTTQVNYLTALADIHGQSITDGGNYAGKLGDLSS